MNQDFKNWAIGQGSVATPIGTYQGECVSLIQQYLSRVFNIPFQARGHAKDWATNANVLSNFDKVNSPQAGDIGVSGATASNPFGHIWIYLSPTQILEQNGRVSRKVSVGTSYLKPIAILRRKGESQGGDDMSTVGDNEIDQMSWVYFGYGASQEFIKQWRGTESNTFERMMFDHPVTQAYRNQVADWRKTAEASKSKFKPYDGPTLYREDM